VTGPALKRTFGLRLLSLLPALVVGGIVLLAAPPPPADGAVFSLASLHLQDFQGAASDDGLWSIAVRDDDPDSSDDDDSDDSPDALIATTPVVSDSAHEHETTHVLLVESPIQRASDRHALRAPPR
jgi:hypothetical protein